MRRFGRIVLQERKRCPVSNDNKTRKEITTMWLQLPLNVCLTTPLIILLLLTLMIRHHEANIIRKLAPDVNLEAKNNSKLANSQVPVAMKRPQKFNISPDKHMDAVKLMRDGQLNKDFRQEVFLGPGHADFENISEKEGTQKLMKIFSMADTSKDEYLDMEELTAWISLQTKKHYEEAVASSKQIFPHIDQNGDGVIHWKEYRTQFLKQRGYDDKDGKVELKTDDEDDYLVYKDRWSRADEDDDDALKKDEFLAFLHPEHSKSTLSLILDELLHDFDADRDDMLSLGEFVSLPLMNDEELEKEAKEDEWVRERKKEFQDNMDLNHDGVCDRKELAAYIDPRNIQHAEGEARHLIGVADDNLDKKLSPREVLSNYYFFIGSKLYNYGRNIHDEF